jgi:hypothetical protein
VTDGIAIVDLDDPLQPVYIKTVPIDGARSVVQQFRFLFVTHDEGLSVIDITDIEKAFVIADNTIEMKEAHNVFVARTYAYVAAGKEGLIIVDIEDPTSMKVYETFTDNIVDARDVVVATTNASLMGYVADGEAGLKVIQLTAPDSQPRFYGFSPEPKPETIAHYTTKKPVISLSRGLERDRAVDETGGQVAVFSRVGSGPLLPEDMRQLYLDKDGKPWFVNDTPKEKQAE